MIALGPLGDRAFLARFATEDDAALWAQSARARGWPGVVDVVLAYETVAIFADPDRIDLVGLEAELRSLEPGPGDQPSGRVIRLPVLYDGEDRAEVAARLGLTVDEVSALHCGQDYRVFAIGFQPGFPYAGELPPALCGLHRRDVPRVRVPAGAVAIVERQTAVYPGASPGGWHLIGRTPVRIVDLQAGHFPIRAGDRIRFEPIGAEEFEAREGERL